jgi:acyl-CoA reductase-like NAD-dependent aldehyde dehydrogenase
MEKFSYYVGGEFKESNKEIEVTNPATEEVFAKIFDATEEHIDFALRESEVAQREWKKVSFKEKAKVLREIAKIIFENLDKLAQLETKEIGKLYKESLFVDIPLGAECFNYYASFLESLEEELIYTEQGWDLIKYEPLGVVAVYLPYNVPLMIFGFSCAAALAAGNALIIKPSEYGSLSILELAKYIDKLDIPKGLISVITGLGETVGKYLAESKVSAISFTGSETTLKKIISFSANSPKKIIPELGGCNLMVVFSDADKERAISVVLGSSFIKQGQMCIGTSLLLIEENIYQDFVKELIEKVSQIKLGDPFDSLVGLGPLISKEHLKRVLEKIEDLKKKGAKVLYGADSPNTKGYYLLPTLIEIKEIIYEEFFAPVVLIKSFKRDQIEKIILDNPTGLVLQIWTKNLKLAKNIAETCDYGTVWINTFAQMNPQTPFGGRKRSGWGKSLGKFGFFEYIQSKHIGMEVKKSPVEGWFGI